MKYPVKPGAGLEKDTKEKSVYVLVLSKMKSNDVGRQSFDVTKFGPI